MWRALEQYLFTETDIVVDATFAILPELRQNITRHHRKQLSNARFLQLLALAGKRHALFVTEVPALDPGTMRNIDDRTVQQPDREHQNRKLAHPFPSRVFSHCANAPRSSLHD